MAFGGFGFELGGFGIGFIIGFVLVDGGNRCRHCQ